MNELRVHTLTGCAPTPLAHYLKALGVLRIVAMQVDRDARGTWRDGVFRLVTVLSEEELVQFFTERYEPTPLLTPWNRDSLFRSENYPGAWAPLRDGHAARYATFRAALRQAERTVAEARARGDIEEKNLLQRRCVATWDESAYAWLHAAFSTDGEEKTSYPSLLGTGGNDGRFEFINNYIDRLLSLFDPETGAPLGKTEAQLRLALFRQPADALERDIAIGQFFPGAAGGANASAGFDGKSLINPWDYVLLFEGALVLRVASLRKLDAGGPSNAAAPFALRSQGVGYGSASAADASSRGEQWMPLWSGAATFDEVSALFDEGRLQGGARRASAYSTLDAARSVARLGVARGVTEFVRFGYFERNGMSTLAVPIGRVEVHLDPSISLLDELDRFVQTVSRAADGHGIGRALRRVEQAMFDAAMPGALPGTWAELLCVLGEVEQTLVASPRTVKAAALVPIPPLSGRWLDKLDDSPETRLAIAIASQSDRELGPLRTNVIPLQGSSDHPHFRCTSDALAKDVSVVWQGRDIIRDLAAVALRRVIDGARIGAGALPLRGRRFARLDDVRRFLDGRVDERRLGRLVRGLLSIRWSGEGGPTPGWKPRADEPDAMHALVRLAYLPEPLGPLRTGLDAAPLRLLAGGMVEQARSRLLARFVALGVRPKLRVFAADSKRAMRLAASVAIPVAPTDLEHLRERIAKPFIDTTTEEGASS